MDFTVQALSVASPNNSTFKTLSQGITTYDYCSYNPETHTCDHEKYTMVLKQLTLANLTLVNRSCITMYLTLANVDNWINLGMFIVNTSNTPAEDIQKANLYLTTLKNSYGAVKARWWDGLAKPFGLLRGGFQVIQIQSITKYVYLEGTCNDVSFYQCLGAIIPTERTAK